jgi:hypothetical protein
MFAAIWMCESWKAAFPTHNCAIAGRDPKQASIKAIVTRTPTRYPARQP